MAKITVTGSAIVITSSIKVEEIELLEKYKPEALTLTEVDEDGDKVPKFKIGLGDGHGSVNKFGISFAKKSLNPDGYATVTGIYNGEADSVKETVADEVGAPVDMLRELEETVPAAVDEVKTKRQAVIDSIELA